MRRWLTGFLLIGTVLVVVVLAIMLRQRAAQRSPASLFGSTESGARQAITNSVEFVKSRVTGGVGVAVAIDSSTKLPVVGAVAIGSPAHEAGIHTGDIITRIGGIATTGLFLKRVVENLRGFTGANVPVTVLRGTKYLDFVIRRTSMKSLQEKTFTPYE
jgi:C-terminal processing protease CtpA/Prc